MEVHGPRRNQGGTSTPAAERYIDTALAGCTGGWGGAREGAQRPHHREAQVSELEVRK